MGTWVTVFIIVLIGVWVLREWQGRGLFRHK